MSDDLDELARKSRRAAMISGLGALLVAAALGFGVQRLLALRGAVDSTSDTLARQREQVARATAELDKARATLDTTQKQLADSSKAVASLKASHEELKEDVVAVAQ